MDNDRYGIDTGVKGELSRRGFLKWNAMLASTLAAGGASQGLLPMERAPSTGGHRDRSERIVRVGCPSHNCGGKCLLKVHVKAGVITRIEGDDRPTDEVADPEGGGRGPFALPSRQVEVSHETGGQAGRREIRTHFLG